MAAVAGPAFAKKPGPPDAPPFCGNNVVEADRGEQCDGSNLSEKSCATLGFDGGTLRCTNSCQYDTADCTECGNGQIEAGEQCDGTPLAGQTCATQGFGGGTLACGTACTFDTSGCTPDTCTSDLSACNSDLADYRLQDACPGACQTDEDCDDGEGCRVFECDESAGCRSTRLVDDEVCQTWYPCGAGGGEDIIGSACADHLVGTSCDDRIYGLDANDYIAGGSSDDVIVGGEGHDTIIGGPGADVLHGGPGNDVLYADDESTEPTTQPGEAERNVILGGPGNDVVYAQNGVRDHVDCGRGQDTVFLDVIDLEADYGCETIFLP